LPKPSQTTGLRPPEAIATSRGQDPALYLDSPFLLLGTTQTIPDDLARLADLGVDDVTTFRLNAESLASTFV
jgi:hypothetical protein